MGSSNSHFHCSYYFLNFWFIIITQNFFQYLNHICIDVFIKINYAKDLIILMTDHFIVTFENFHKF